MSDEFRAGAVEIHSLGGDRRLIVGLRSGQALKGTDADAELLTACYSFRPIEAHAADAARRDELQGARNLASKGPRWLRTVVQHTERTVPPDPRRAEPIAQRLRQFADAGLLVSRSSFMREASASEERPPAPIRIVGFTTRNRAALLTRAIESWHKNASDFGRPLEVTVIDDSRTPDEERSTYEALEQLARRGVSIRVAGPARRDSYGQALAEEAGVDPELVRFALRGDGRCPISTGSARNSLLLDSVGEPYVLTDDDGVARLAGCPEPLPGLALSSQSDPTEFWFYRNRDDLIAEVGFVDRDVFGEHERLLGRSAAELIGEAAQGAGMDLGMMSVELEGRLRDGGMRVRTSMAGVGGDSGIGETAHLFTSPQTRQRLTVSEDFFAEAVRNRQSLRLPPRPTLTDGVLTMAGNLGLDASTLFPPFCPVQRNSDGLLGRTLNQCFPAACKGYLDVAAWHDPPPGRTQSMDDWWASVLQMRFSEVLGVLLEDRPPSFGRLAPPDALHALGGRLSAMAAEPHAAFRGRLRGLMLRRESTRLTRDRVQEEREMPAFYAALRLRHVETIRQAIVTEAYLEPRDLPGDQPLALAQEVIGRFGALLAVWPQIWEAAMRIKAAGQRLAQPLRGR